MGRGGREAHDLPTRFRSRIARLGAEVGRWDIKKPDIHYDLSLARDSYSTKVRGLTDGEGAPRNGLKRIISHALWRSSIARAEILEAKAVYDQNLHQL